MIQSASPNVQHVIDFLSSIAPEEVDWSALPNSPDYAAIVRMAERRGVRAEEADVRRAFALIMRARLVASTARGARSA